MSPYTFQWNGNKISRPEMVVNQQISASNCASGLNRQRAPNRRINWRRGIEIVHLSPDLSFDIQALSCYTFIVSSSSSSRANQTTFQSTRQVSRVLSTGLSASTAVCRACHHTPCCAANSKQLPARSACDTLRAGGIVRSPSSPRRCSRRSITVRRQALPGHSATSLHQP